MGVALLHQHRLDIAQKIRVSTWVARTLDKCLELYPRIAREPPKLSEEPESSRFAELGVIAVELTVL